MKIHFDVPECQFVAREREFNCPGLARLQEHSLETLQLASDRRLAKFGGLPVRSSLPGRLDFREERLVETGDMR